ncbi:hypothetical protein QCA50_012580 [Cerrena zonata]|uniref:Uncharacterized protein n=1 Tax=Cerrena zonata TaxID=2478898 RepID=A0AAW0G3N1_9APHY
MVAAAHLPVVAPIATTVGGITAAIDDLPLGATGVKVAEIPLSVSVRDLISDIL